MSTLRYLVSFLGRGQSRPDGSYGYTPIIYSWADEADRSANPVLRQSAKREFVQAAVVELRGPFDKIILVSTEAAFGTNLDRVKDEIRQAWGAAPEPLRVQVSESLDRRDLWHAFNELLDCIPSGAHVSFDVTHGYRAVPVVFSAAIDLLRKTKDVVVDGVYYGAFEQRVNDVAPIIDLADFYQVSEWGDAVVSFQKYLDSRPMATLAERVGKSVVGVLANGDVVKTMRAYGDALRDCEAHVIGRRATALKEAIESRQERAQPVQRALMDMLLRSAAEVLGAGEMDGSYDLTYFRVQIRYATVLAERGLLMQGFTVLREAMSALAMTRYEYRWSNDEGRKLRERCTNPFNGILSGNRDGVERDDLGDEKTRRFAEVALVFADQLEADGLLPKRSSDPKRDKATAREQAKGIAEEVEAYHKWVDAGRPASQRQPPEPSTLRATNLIVLDAFFRHLRNGFDHAWTNKAEAPQHLREKLFVAIDSFEAIVDHMDGLHYFRKDT